MNSFLFWLEDMLFWIELSFDYLFVLTTIFTLIYLAVTGFTCLIALKVKIMPHPVGIPLLFVCAFIACCSFPGDITIYYLGMLFQFMLSDVGITWFRHIVGCVWVAGTLLYVFNLYRQYYSLRRILIGLQEVLPEERFITALSALGIHKQIILKDGSNVAISSWGILKSYIILPTDFTAVYTEEERFCVYLHELTHIKNRDSFKYLLISIVKSIFWFHPVVRCSMNRYKNNLEIMCDRAVIRMQNISPIQYAELITKTLALQNSLLVGFSSGYNEVTRRFDCIFCTHKLLSTKRNFCLFATSCILVFFISFSFCGSIVNVAHSDMEMPKEKYIMQTQDGKDLEVSTVFYWRGALGDYSVMNAELEHH